MAKTPRSHRPARPAHRTAPLLPRPKVEALEDRSVPSTTFPLNGTTWTEMGPRPIAAQAPGENTTSPGNLASTGRITDVTLHPTDPNTFYISAAGGGVWKTTDGGDSWASLTERLPASTPGLEDQYRTLSMGSVTLSNQNPNRVYAGEGEQNFSGDSYPGNGLLKSADGGLTWKLITGTRPGRTEFVNTTIPKIVVLPNPAAPTDASRELVYMLVSSAGFDNGLYLSRDGGETFDLINGKMYQAPGTNGNNVRRSQPLTDFEVDATNPGVVYIAVSGGTNQAFTAYNLSGIYKTTNALDPNPDLNTSYVVTFGGNGSFVPGSLVGRIQNARAPPPPTGVYPARTPGARGTRLGVWRSTNGGTDWLKFGNVPNFVQAQGAYNIALAVDPNKEGRLAMAGLDRNGPSGAGPNLVVFTEDGLNPDSNAVAWSGIGQDAAGEGPHVDVHSLEFSRANGQLWLTSDGGVFRTATISSSGNGKFTPDWVSANGDPAKGSPLNVFESTGVALHPTDYNQMLAGGQDNGTVRFTDGVGRTREDVWAWPEVDGGDGGRVVYDFVFPQNAYRVSPVGSFGAANFVRKTTDGGVTWQAAAAGIVNPNASLFYPPLEIDPSQSNRAFLGTDQLNETTDGASSWHALAGLNLPFVTGVNVADGGPKPVVTAIGISRFDPNIMYVAVNNRGYAPSGAVVSYGQAIYRVDIALSIYQNFPAYFDVSPFGAGASGQQSTVRGIATLSIPASGGALRRLPGLTMPPFPNAAAEPAPNDFFGNITKIAVDPYDADILVIVTDAHEIYRTTNGGASWARMNEAGLPDGITQQSFQGVVIDPNILPVNGQNDDFYYIATNIGVYKLSDPTQDWAGQQWTRVGGESQTDARVEDLVINTSTGILLAGSYGRGAWQIQIRPYVAGVVFTDTNGNGIRDGNEPITAGKQVIVYDLGPAKPVEVASTTTDANGQYRFVSLPNGQYSVVSPPSSNLFVDPANALFQSTPDRTYTVTQQTTINGADIGSFTRTSLSGTVYEDLDGDGKLDAGEPGLAGRLVQLLNSATGAVLATITTANDGTYSFLGLGQLQDRANFSPTTGFPIIPYRVRVASLPTGTVSTKFPPDVTLTSGVPVAGQNLGEFRLARIAGTVFEDTDGNGVLARNVEPPLAGWTVFIDDNNNGTPDAGEASTVSDAAGGYVFANLLPKFDANGNPLPYRVREVVQPGYTRSSQNPPDTVLTSGLDTGDPVSGLVGKYDFGNMRPGGLSGTVFEDTNGDGVRQPGETTTIPGATVQLVNPGANLADPSDDTVVQSTTTDATGGYAFANLFPLGVPGGNTIPYLVRVVQPDAVYIQTSADRRVFLTSNGTTPGQDLGYFRRTTITGLAFEDVNGNGQRDAGEPAQPGFPVNLVNSGTLEVVGTTTTDANGQYVFTGLGPLQAGGKGGAVIPYRVSIAVAGYLQTTSDPGDIVLTSGVPAAGPTLGVFREVAFRGVLFDDLNGDGVRQAGEPGLAGRTVLLVNAAGQVARTATTDASGNYLLNAGPGTFSVRPATPAGAIQTTVDPAPIGTTSGMTIPTTDIGSFTLVTTAGVVFNDLNGDGARQTGEPAIAGATVRLLKADGTVVAAATSDAAGRYSFPGIGPGQYQVQFVPPAGAYATTPNPFPFAATSGRNVDRPVGAFTGVTVFGRVVEDLNDSGTVDDTDPGVGGFTVLVVNAAGQTVATAAVAADGSFTIPNVPQGPLTVQLQPRTGWTVVGPQGLPISPTSGVNLNAGTLLTLRRGSVSGSVFADFNRNARRDANEPGRAGMTVGLFDADGNLVDTYTTGADGNYAFFNRAPGAYTVRLLTVPADQSQTSPRGTFVYSVNLVNGSTNAGNAADGRDFGLVGRKRYAIAADGGGGPRVQVYDATSGQLLRDAFVYEPSFTGGVRVASADVTGDGVDDLLTTAGPGGGPRVRVLDGVTGDVVYDYFAYEPSFRDGLFVSAGDVDGDGFADIITGTSPGGGPRVTVFSGRTGQQIADYFAYDPAFRGGVRVGAADVNGDGRAEVVTGPGVNRDGTGQEPRVITWQIGTPGNPPRQYSSFLAFDPTFTGGVYVAGTSLDTNGTANVVVGSGAGLDPASARVFEGGSGRLVYDFPVFTTGTEVRVASFDTNSDGIPELVFASGPGVPSQVKILDGKNRREIASLSPFEPSFLGGVFIG